MYSGKTTTLQALDKYLNDDYFVISMDFQMQMSHTKFRNENSFSLAFAKAFVNSFYANPDSQNPGYNNVIKIFQESYRTDPEHFELVELFQSLSEFCSEMSKGVVLMIDEVDSAANNQVFLDFLAQLRGYYMNRRRFAAFQSVILAGVCDIKNLKRKLRQEDEHKDNSPWNIAADFDIEMSFSPEQIQAMLEDYEADYKTGMNTEEISQEIYDYTEGYPYLVSRLCQILEKQFRKENRQNAWTHTGLLDAVRLLTADQNSLFDDMAKKIKDYPELISVGTMFGFLKDREGQAAISNRIFEIWFYNLFIAEEAIGSKTYDAGQKGKN